MDERINLLARVARTALSSDEPRPSERRGDERPGAEPRSILTLAAASYGARPMDENTVPTGFDLSAAALFESIVEGAYLVATADGVFDEDERLTFERIVVAACGGTVSKSLVTNLVSDLSDQLAEDGLERRVERLALGVHRKEHARELIRIAALMAHASEDVSDVERAVLGKLAGACKLDVGSVETALEEVKSALAAAAAASA